VLSEFEACYHTERNHQGIGNNIIDAGAEVGQTDGDNHYRERLGGMLGYDYRDAALKRYLNLRRAWGSGTFSRR